MAAILEALVGEGRVANQLMAQQVVDIHLAKGVTDSLGISPDTLRNNIFLNNWLDPTLEGRNYIPARGDTQRTDVGSATLILKNGASKPHLVDIVAKDVLDPENALKELRILERIQEETTIRAVKPFAVIEAEVAGKSAAWILTQLEKGVVPVGKLRYESFFPAQKQRFTNELALFLADAGNQGFMHQDARMRNIGYDLTQRPFTGSRHSDFLFFDVETSRLLYQDTLSEMQNPHQRPSVVKAAEYYGYNDRFLDDAADALEDLNFKHRMGKEYLKREFADVYLGARKFTWGQRSERASLAHILHRRFIVD